MKNGMKRIVAALALCIVAVCAYADSKTDALIKAAINNDVSEVVQLIKSRAKVNAKGYNGKTALMVAAENNAVDAAKVLIEARADVNAKDYNGNTALIHAVAENAIDVAKLLIEAGADVNTKGYGSVTALMYAAHFNATDIAKRLIEVGADVNAKNRYGATALMYAAAENATDIAKRLIEAGAEMDAKDINGDTALVTATEVNATDVVKLLTEAGADVNVLNAKEEKIAGTLRIWLSIVYVKRDEVTKKIKIVKVERSAEPTEIWDIPIGATLQDSKMRAYKKGEVLSHQLGTFYWDAFTLGNGYMCVGYNETPYGMIDQNCTTISSSIVADKPIDNFEPLDYLFQGEKTVDAYFVVTRWTGFR